MGLASRILPLMSIYDDKTDPSGHKPTDEGISAMHSPQLCKNCRWARPLTDRVFGLKISANWDVARCYNPKYATTRTNPVTGEQTVHHEQCWAMRVFSGTFKGDELDTSSCPGFETLDTT